MGRHRIGFGRSALIVATMQLLLLAGCASMSSLQSARALPPGEMMVVGAGGVTGVHIESDDPFIDDEELLLPVTESMVRLGVWPGLDVGLKYFVGGVLADAKYQFFGLEPTSVNALAAGFGIDYSAGDVGWWDIYFPLYASHHPSEFFTAYASPRYVLRSAGILGTHHLVGVVLGIGVGEQRKAFVEVGYLVDTGLGFLEGPTFQGTVGLVLNTRTLFPAQEPETSQ